MSKLTNTGIIFGNSDEEQEKPITEINGVGPSSNNWNNSGEITIDVAGDLESRVESLENTVCPLRFLKPYTVLNSGSDPYSYLYNSGNNITSEPTIFEGPIVDSFDDKYILNCHENKIAFFGRPQSAKTLLSAHHNVPGRNATKVWQGIMLKYEPPNDPFWQNRKLKFKIQLKSGGSGGTFDENVVGSIEHLGETTSFYHYRGTTKIDSSVVGNNAQLGQDGQYLTKQPSLTSEYYTIQPNDYFMIRVGEGGDGYSYSAAKGFIGGLGTRSYDPPIVKFTGDAGEGSGGGAGGGTYSDYAYRLDHSTFSEYSDSEIFNIEDQRSAINFNSIGRSGKPSTDTNSDSGGGGCGCLAIEFVGYWGE